MLNYDINDYTLSHRWYELISVMTKPYVIVDKVSIISINNKFQ